METVFSRIVNMSLTGSLVILLVLAARWCLRRQPKIFSYALWAVVLFRLLCPVSISAPVSALKVARPQVEQTSQAVSRVSYVAAEPENLPAGDFTPVTPAVEGKKTLSPMAMAAWIWLAGVGVMGLYSLLSLAHLRRRLVGSTPLEGNIFLSDYVDSPFVLGVIRPRIYLPTTTPPEERPFIVAHEAHHIRRLDHIWKGLAFLALCLHWFNPLVWLSFLMAGQDMEMSCDEAVIHKLGEHTRADYAQALLRLSTKRTVIRGTPLAFGEGDTKGRVKNMANWKKPKVWVSLICVVACVALLVACAVNPRVEMEVTTKSVPKTTQPTQEEIDVFTTYVQMPEGYTFGDSGRISRDSDGKVVGGQVVYPIPEGVFDPEDGTFHWLTKVGIPDFSDESLVYTGGMSDFRGGWNAEFVSNVPEGEEITVRRWHNFRAIDGKVFDLWLDTMEVDWQDFQNAIHYDKAPDTTVPPEEQEAYQAIEKCRAVVDLVGDSSAHIHGEQSCAWGDVYIAHWSSTDSYTDGADWLQVTDLMEDDCRVANLCVEDTWYQNPTALEIGETVTWELLPEDLEPPEGPGCWLGHYVVNRTFDTYLETVETEMGSCIKLRHNLPLIDGGGEDHYFLNFYFDHQGSFQKVEIVSTIDDTTYATTETIVSLDEATVRAAIDREYLRAQGHHQEQSHQQQKTHHPEDEKNHH